ncbi:RHS repeat-associated core domain-containing protein [Aliifodinibius sp. S!AR15-10]|uniref:RHS repeat domain-containing protein n=1 Tax=Aliifodinibius sp. S!AR15-10 TaxID=2950437 RepID=UPI00285E05F4|nr:RHS repeat-associated core domain-containing protein [Aliifodinibius sp. S!AR15-10]MDR8391157.1 RHS repeat-associated core domain-containing protein [Aliifodinibius sp. S!AR15-10]
MTKQAEKRNLYYKGNNIVLIGEETGGFGPGTIIHIDADGDGVFERQTIVDAEGLYTIGIEIPSSLTRGNDEFLKSESCYETANAGKERPVLELSMYMTSADESRESPTEILNCIQIDVENLAASVPENLVYSELVVPDKDENEVALPKADELLPGIPLEKLIPVEPGICTCSPCGEEDTLIGSSLEAYTQSYTPTEHGVELATGKIRHHFPITDFQTRKLGFNLNLHHISLTDYNGPWGQSISHSFNMMIIRSGERTGQIVTPDLRCYYIYSEDGKTWELPCGFFSRLTLDPNMHRWTLTHFSGLETQFFEGATNYPGYPVRISDPNGNEMRLEYDSSGTLCHIITDLEQVQTLDFGSDGRINSFTDHIQRTWSMLHDIDGRLVQVKTPDTEYADIPASTEITEKDLPSVLKTQTRVWTLGYLDMEFPNHIRQVTDPRGAVPKAFEFDEYGRVNVARINSNDVIFQYQAGNEEFAIPIAFEPLEETNLCVSVTDREQNISVYEIHGAAGGPLNKDYHLFDEYGRQLDTHGKFGLRRKLEITESGKGNEPLRPDEPPFWEQRWLHDCDCLSPAAIAEPFRGDESQIEYDDWGIPVNYPVDRFTYNTNRQILRRERTDGTDSIVTESTYQPYSFGDQGQFSRMLNHSESRAFDDNPIYSGLSFEHTYAYDSFGNKTRYESPAVTRGVDTTQVIAESWTYNEFGQTLIHTDPNCNLTIHTYFDGPSSGGDINTKGAFGGYLQSVTRGAEGSFDAVTNITSQYKVNALGMITKMIDHKGFFYDTEYNDLQEITCEIEPAVTLHNGLQFRYETRFIYDGAGNKVIERRSNIDLDGTVPQIQWIDRSKSFDEVNNLLSDRVEVDADDANDLINRYAYDGNDDPTVTRKPKGNREFWLYDERRLRFKFFYGVAPVPDPSRTPLLDPANSLDDNPSAVDISSGYPSDKRAETLENTSFVGLTINTYDARSNNVERLDGRGNLSYNFFDFDDRQIAFSDQNGNGWLREYDDASNILTGSRGAISQETGEITELLERSYMRFDENGRRYKQVLDIDLSTDESSLLDPEDGKNSSYKTVFDPGSRTVRKIDANGNATIMDYDAADRPLTTTDAMGNRQISAYDANSNVISLTEIEIPGPGAVGQKETYVTTYSYDELNRQTEQHIRGLDGDSIDHAWYFAYDSRSNERLVQDAEKNFTITTFDDNNRPVMMQRFDGNPFTGNFTELQHYESGYDQNSNLVEERALSDIKNPGSIQVTRHAFDDLDRKIRTVYPDSDDPVDGSGDGPDRIYDRVEVIYDPNSNPIQVTDQREVVFNTSFDQGNRPVEQEVSLPPDVPGTTRQTFRFDALNRTVSARNNYAKVDQVYDAFSRLVKETQSIRLDGMGFSKGWQQPVKLVHSYDKHSNRTSYQVVDGRKKDLDVTFTHDALNRVGTISSAYFREPFKPIADYTYIGPWRVQKKKLGNGAGLSCTYDTKRRIRVHQWDGPDRLLTGFEYAYDRMDNATYEGFTHDLGLYDHFQYNNRYEITGVTYRVPGSIAPATPTNAFIYDDLFNRKKAAFGNPFDSEANTNDSYSNNSANECIQLKRNGRATNPTYDRAGNATSFLVRPMTGNPDRKDITASARWDAYNLLFDIDPVGANSKQEYRYDPMCRRVATLELNDSEIAEGGRRYIYDGWNVVEERLFEEGATLAKAQNVLERIYVNGQQVDEPLLAAIDRDADGKLGDGNDKNILDQNADQEYYYLNNRLGSIMALLDADNPNRILEYYRYSIYSEPTVLPVLDDNGDGLEGTPFDLSDNFEAGSQGASLGFGNYYLFTARRFDEKTGLYYYRNRYYEVFGAKFLGRDPLGYIDNLNLYTFVQSNPVNNTDPVGLFDSTQWVHEETVSLKNSIGPTGSGPLYSQIITELDKAFNELTPVIGSVTITDKWFFYQNKSSSKGFDSITRSLLRATIGAQKEYKVLNLPLLPSIFIVKPKVTSRTDRYAFQFYYVPKETKKTNNQIKFSNANELSTSVTLDAGIEWQYVTIKSSGTISKTASEAAEIFCPKAFEHTYHVLVKGSGYIFALQSGSPVSIPWNVTSKNVGTVSIYDDDENAKANLG